MRPESTDEQTMEALLEEVESLRGQLRDAEAILDAIRFDRVDALVVSNREGEHVRTIESIGVIANSIFDQVVQPIFILDEGLRILRANPAAAALCGSGIEGRPLHEVLPLRALPDSGRGDVDSEVLPLDWIRERRQLLRREAGFVQPDGTSRYFLVEAKVFSLSAERLTGGIVTLVDITAEKRAEIELEVRNEQLRYQFELTTAITDSAAEALVLLDEQGRVLFMNPAAELLFGGDLTELGGRMLGDRVSLEEDREEEELSGDPVQLVGVSRTDWNFYAILSRGDGARIPVQGSIAPVTGEGTRLRGSVLVLRDVSELREAEEALRSSEDRQRQSQKMEAIGLLAGGIAHDFNNLLTAINGYADLLTVTTAPASAEHEFASEIRRAGARAADLTSQLLAFGRKQVQSPRLLNLNACIEDVGRMLRRLIGERIEVAMKLDPALGLIRADPGQVEQVLLNLAINARDSMPEGGLLTLETSNVEWSGNDPHSPLHGMPPGPFVKLSLRDEGVGMDVEVQERAFEPFFSTKGTGSGLGLSTVYGIVQQTGGRITLQSELGRGSDFQVYFPQAERGAVEAAPPPSSPSAAAPPGTETILVVEDEEIVRRLVHRVLQAQGYTVLAASGGDEALAIEEAHEGRIHMLLTDVVMPGVGGRELAARIEERRKEIKVAFMSGYMDDPALRNRAGEEFGFIDKPFTSAELARFVRETLDG